MITLRNMVLLLLISNPGVSIAATLYMGVSETYTTLQSALSAMSGGDTLIIRDGVYSGTSNVIDHTHLPPSGSAEAYTTIRAENVGGVIFDGDSVRQMFILQGSSVDVGPHHIIFNGIKWRNSNHSLVTVSYADYIKFFKCSTVDAVGYGDDGDGFVVSVSTNILFEECWSFGAGRKHFYAGGGSENIIFRRCVARHDRHLLYLDQECFMAYDCWNVAFQNCIAIDSDQTFFYTDGDGSSASAPSKAYTTRYGGGVYTPHDITYRGCISLNNQSGPGWVGSNNVEHAVIDCIHWSSVYGNRIRGAGVAMSHCTFGGVSGTSTWSPLAYLEYDDNINNSLLYGAYYGIFASGVDSDYNCLYAITDEYYTTQAIPGTHDICVTNANAIDPMDGVPGNGTAALLYLPRVSEGSDLKAAASDGGDIGATITKRIGVSGSLYGESGWDTLTDEDVWPFPNEALIRIDMAAYSYTGTSEGDVIRTISGARGFCAAGKQLNGTDDITLTSYVWEYLGNQIPADIYGSGTPATPNRVGAGTANRMQSGTSITIGAE